MQIQYNNYLSDKTDSKFSSRNTLTDLSKVRQNDNRRFEFAISPEESEIVSQAELFATFISATGLFENSFLNNANRTKYAYELIRDSYIYSYMKALFYSFNLAKNNIASIMGPNSNLMFSGHKLLHDIIAEGYIQHFTPPSNVISIEVNVDTDVIGTLETFSLWNDVYDPKYGRIFNMELETILNFFKTKCGSVVSVGNLNTGADQRVSNLMQLPIGNLAYGPNMQQILYVETRSFSSDKCSFYWNKANCVQAITIPEIDADDEIYDTILVSSYDETGRTFEVHSITGFNPLGGPRNAFEFTRSSGGRNDDTNSNSGGGNPYNKSNFGKQNPQKNPRAKQNTKLAAVKSKVSKVTGSAVSLLKAANEVLTPENLDLVSGVIEAVTGKRPKLKQLRSKLGISINSILSDNGISLNDKIVGSTEEYDAFYVDSQYSGGRWNSQLVGNVKRITDKPK
jgi:hypothetical protein